MAKPRRLSDNRVLVELIEEGIEARKQKEQTFFNLAKRFRAAKDPDEVKSLGDQMGQFVFRDRSGPKNKKSRGFLRGLWL